MESLYSAVSPGTERLVFFGKVPSSLWGAMRSPHMAGDFSFPIKYGYSLVGRVVEGPAPLLGKIGHVLHPHQNRCVVPAEDVFIVPEGIPPQRATLASNLETAVNAIWDSGLSLGERVLVVGFGTIGALVARLAGMVPGTEVWVVDRQPEKLELAGKMGFRACPPDGLKGRFDTAFHASASSAGLQLSLASLGFEGRVIELSWYGTEPVSLSLGEEFHPLRQKIISSQVSSISPRQRSRWDLSRRRKLVFRLLEDRCFDSHLSDVIPFAEISQAYPKILRSPTPGLGYIIKYDQRGSHVQPNR